MHRVRSQHLMSPVVGWLVGLMCGVEFLQWTVVQPLTVQEVLGFRRGDLDVGRWWAVATYAVVHPSLVMLALNGYLLLVFGPRLERLWGASRFIGLAAMSAIGGWAAHLFLGGSAPLMGGTAVAFGVLGAHGMRWGHEERMLPGGFTARVRWLAAVLAVMTLLIGLQEPLGGGVPFLAHLGGFGMAWLFARSPRVLFVERIREGVSAVPEAPPEDQLPRVVPRTPPRTRAQRDSIDEVIARSNAEDDRRRTIPMGRQVPHLTVELPDPASTLTLDAILDKISAEGLHRLTPSERRFLDDHSRRLRDH